MTWLHLLLPTLLLTSPSIEVARVGTAVVTRADVEARLEFMRSTGDRGGVLDAVNGLVGELLLEGEARRLGLAASPAVKAKVEQEMRRLASVLFEERELLAGLGPADAELRTLYHSTADSVRLDLLVFESQPVAAAAAARAAKGGDLAAEAALAVVRPVGALTIRAQLDPKLVDLAFKATIGAVQGPVEASVGWAVFKVVERHVGDDAGFQAQRAALVRHATKGALARARAHLVKQLRAQQGVKLDEAFLDALPKGTETTAAQQARVIAVVGGRPLTYGEVLPSVKQLASASGHNASGTVKKQVAWQEIEARLVQDAAVQRGYADDPLVKAKLQAIESAALAQALAGQLAATAARPSEQEVAAFYGRRQGEIGQPLEQARPAIVSHLAAQKRAEAILAKVRELRGKTSVEVKQAAVNAIERGR